METKRKNLKRALDEYMMEFNACRCGPCQNNGEPVLIYSSCVCECQAGSQGAACENTRRAGKMNRLEKNNCKIHHSDPC